MNKKSEPGRTHENIPALIRSLYASLSPAEQRVADYALEHLGEVIYKSITELANECGVGEATIIRFCRSLGLSGYNEFKLLVSRVLPKYDDIQAIKSSDSFSVLVGEVSRSNARVIQETAELIDVNELRRAVDSIMRARKVEFYGVGASGITALDARYRFLRIGIDCDAYTDAHFQSMSAALLQAGDVAVGVSNSGSTKDTVHSLEVAKESGATTICITSMMHSPITRVADIKLIAATRESPLQSGDLRYKIGQIHVLDLLFTGILLKKGDEAAEKIRRTADAVADKHF